MILNIVNLGLIEYGKALELQEQLLSLCEKKTIDDTLLLLEHPPVITMGTRAEESNIYLPREQLDKMGVCIYNVSRGGDVTYHGPGQIVGYPIMNLTRHGKDIHAFIFKIQEVIIRLLEREYGIQASREFSKYTGVWIGNEKITAIGIALKRWVSMHGFAFNVNTDLSHFKWINPCGLSDRSITSLQKLTNTPQDIDHLNSLIGDYFCEVFGMEGRICTVESLIG